MHRRRATAIFTLCVLGLLAACVPPYEGPAGTPRVGFVSDSVLGMTEARLLADLRQDHQVSFGRTNALKVAELQGTADEYAGQNPEVVVISAGTNDNFGRVSPTTTVNELKKMEDKFPGSCVTFVTLNTHLTDADVSWRAAQVNNWIRTQSQVADWDAFVGSYYAAGSPAGPLTYDLIHVTPQGEPYLTNVVNSAVRRCRNRGLPFGSLDAAGSPSANRVRVQGWAIDADTTSPIQVHVYVDGAFVGARTADGNRPDVGNGFGFGPNHGFDTTFDGIASGRHNVCVFGINTGTNGSGNTAIGCRSVTVG